LARTEVGVVVDEYDLLNKMWWRTVENAVNGSEKNGPCLVVEDDDDACQRQILSILQCFASDDKTDTSSQPFCMNFN